MSAYVGAILVAPQQDAANDIQLQDFLGNRGPLLAASWLLMLVCGLAWLLLVTGLRGRVEPGFARDLMVAAAVAGQAVAWAGASLDAAFAAPTSRAVPLPVYEAFGEAGHLAMAAGTAATGLALIGLSRCATPQLWGTTMSRATAVAGAILVLAAVIGPVSAPVYALWLLLAAIQLLRSAPSASVTTAPGVAAPSSS